MDGSDLNVHEFTIGHSDTDECMCHAKTRVVTSLYNWFFSSLFLWTSELIKPGWTDFQTCSKFRKYEALVMGMNTDFQWIEIF